MNENIKIVTPLERQKFSDTWYQLSEEKHFWFFWRFKALLQLLKRLEIPIDKKLKVLDIGCGVGTLRNQLENNTDWLVDATDLDYGGLCNVPAGRGQVMYYDITKKSVEFREKYDAIILFDVIEHIEHTQPFIESALFHVKKGGYILINVPALQTLYSYYDEIVGHYRRYNKKTIRNGLFNFPIEILDVNYWGFTIIPLLTIRKFLLTFQRQKSEEEIINNGFKPPSKYINSALVRLMKLELKLMKEPPLGSSLLLIGKKIDK